MTTFHIITGNDNILLIIIIIIIIVIIIIIIITIMSSYNNDNSNNNNKHTNNNKSAKAHDELGTCRPSLVCPGQPVLCIPMRSTNTTVLTIMLGNIIDTRPRYVLHASGY